VTTPIPSHFDWRPLFIVGSIFDRRLPNASIRVARAYLAARGFEISAHAARANEKMA
jgi:hypothetical protein